MNTVRNLVRLILAVVCLVGVLVLGMVLVFWVRSRIHEIGVFLAIGIGKARIVGQFVIVTCSDGVGCGLVLAWYRRFAIGVRVVHAAGQCADAASLSSLQVDALPPAQTSLILLLGCGVIAIALVVSLASVLARSPKSHSFLHELGVTIMSVCLQLDHVDYMYGAAKIRVLSDVSADFEAGKMYAITGPSGAGKSTLLSLLARVGFPVEGRGPFRRREHRRDGCIRSIAVSMCPWCSRTTI